MLAIDGIRCVLAETQHVQAQSVDTNPWVFDVACCDTVFFFCPTMIFFVEHVCAVYTGLAEGR